ncbi:MAG TPA: papain-like cysteine protease family protein [Haliangiales bacterium]|nr:papain-like cysteine protease family protein [Haliangiales bacterium]
MPRRLLPVAATCLAACSSYIGSARSFSPAAFDREQGWIAIRDVPFGEQESESDCGAAAIGMVVSYWTGTPPGQISGALRPAPQSGIKAGRLRDFARERGLASFLVEGEIADLARELGSGRPVLVGLVKPHHRGTLTHYEVVVGLHLERGVVVTLDPAEGWRQNTLAGFLAEWKPAGRLALIVSSTSDRPGTT